MPKGSWNSVGNSTGKIAGNCIINWTQTNFIKNGTLSGNVENVGESYGFLYSDYDQYNIQLYRAPMGYNMFAKWNTSPQYGVYKNATSIDLYHNINEHITGLQADYPVSSITISGANSTDQNVAFEYNFTSAAVDPSCNVAQYEEVNVIPSSNVISSKPNGYTKTYFNNGLSHADDNNIP